MKSNIVQRFHSEFERILNKLNIYRLMQNHMSLNSMTLLSTAVAISLLPASNQHSRHQIEQLGKSFGVSHTKSHQVG